VVLRIDLATAPPELTLVEPEDLKSFKTEVVLGSHTWIAPETLESLGPQDAEWQEQLGATIAYAREHGWTDERGQVRAHVELVDERGAAEPS
jgi:hypothetical protein